MPIEFSGGAESATEKKKRKRTPQQRAVRTLRRLLILGAALCILYFFARFKHFTVQSNFTEMGPILQPGAEVFLDVSYSRLQFLAPALARDDIVGHSILLATGDGEETEFVVLGRVVGIPGDRITVELIDPDQPILGERFLVNGNPVDAQPTIGGWRPGDNDDVDAAHTLAPRTYFVLVEAASAGFDDLASGLPSSEEALDRRDESAKYDSRTLGPVRHENIYGKVALFWRKAGPPMPAAENSQP